MSSSRVRTGIELHKGAESNYKTTCREGNNSKKLNDFMKNFASSEAVLQERETATQRLMKKAMELSKLLRDDKLALSKASNEYKTEEPLKTKLNDNYSFSAKTKETQYKALYSKARKNKRANHLNKTIQLEKSIDKKSTVLKPTANTLHTKELKGFLAETKNRIERITIKVNKIMNPKNFVRRQNN
eukprot:TRINITY_DN1048_c0_g2_i2.p1 TRINITY_DN1048_c0_g2~~TRINITY_DN1048_c0_g2_i2.p1  ORF type:complete len:207 (+),score=26.94 TRINITY_DN1048_c0_g2_i2:65-622(+)